MHRAALSLVALAPLAWPQTPDGVEVGACVAAQRISRFARAAVFQDPVEAALARGEWAPPAAGDAIGLPDEEPVTWETVELSQGDGGWWSGPSLRSGWASVRVSSDAERVVLLDMRGVRHGYVNGVPVVGDLYNLGLARQPVLLSAGENEVLLRSGRGGLKLRFEESPAPVFFQGNDHVLPDLIRGEEQGLWLGVVIVNATTEWQGGWTVRAMEGDLRLGMSLLEALPPLSVQQAQVPFCAPSAESAPDYRLDLVAPPGASPPEPLGFTLRVRDSGQKHRRTFLSAIEGSVQYYAVTPMAPTEDAPEKPALFLSTHGASVEATNQANSYSRKDWGIVVAPTNRRPFGFDWEDWGRLDALEVLAEAQQRFGTDPARTYVTGHSMGGHGAWQLGVHFPDRFAACAPSAGWLDFWSYGGALAFDDPGPVEALLLRATSASRTGDLLENLAPRGVYVLHGDADDNVPVSQARDMRALLAGFHTNFAYYERPGAGHWWGNACVDWPPLFAFLKGNVRPEDAAVRRVDFRTVNPGVSSRLHWVTIEAQLRSMSVSRVTATANAKEHRLEVTTENVARLALRTNALGEVPEDGTLRVDVDGSELELPWPKSGEVHLSRSEGDGPWVPLDVLSARAKTPARAGPFKDAWRNGAVLVVGTDGSEEERAAALQKARYDAAQFRYRGNGAFQVLLDVAFEPAAGPDHNVILYGNADTNSAWAAVLPEDCPVQVRAGVLAVGERTLTGDDLGCLFVYPRAGSDVACVGVVGGTGPAGLRASTQLPWFVSGTGFPDWTVFDPSICELGADGVRGCGYFGPDWGLDSGESAWR